MEKPVVLMNVLRFIMGFRIDGLSGCPVVHAVAVSCKVAGQLLATAFASETVATRAQVLAAPLWSDT